MLEVVMEYYLVGLVVTLLLSLVYLSINLFRDKINMFTVKVWLAIIGYSLLSYIGLIVVLYAITTIFKEGSKYEKYNFK